MAFCFARSFVKNNRIEFIFYLVGMVLSFSVTMLFSSECLYGTLVSYREHRDTSAAYVYSVTRCSDVDTLAHQLAELPFVEDVGASSIVLSRLTENSVPQYTKVGSWLYKNRA